MHSDSFHRLAKSLADSGEASTIDEAMDTFSRFGVRIRLSPALINDTASQVVALTAINAASRSFQGNVLVDGDDIELNARGFEGTTLHSFLAWSGVKSSLGDKTSSWPTIAVGRGVASEGAIEAWANGWEFGVGQCQRAGELFAPACVAAGGLAVSEAFSLLRKDNPYAGRRSLALSLWSPRGGAPGGRSPAIPPQHAMWLIGLGHLGQAYAWTLGFMEPGSNPLVLQDFDIVTNSTLSTSMLSTPSDINSRKTRVTATWLEARGYQTAIVERRFDEFQRLGTDEPTIALFGVDNPAARRVVEGTGFRLVIDAGLGSGYRDFRAIRMRTFPGPSTAASLWASSSSELGRGPLAPAYQHLLAKGAEQCGVTTLASRAVGAPFVGCVAAGYVLAERVRRQVGGEALGFVDLNLRNPTEPELG